MSCLRQIAAATLMLSGFDAAAAPTVPVPAEVARLADAYLQARTEDGTFRGVVLLARDGQPVFAKAYGYSDVRTRTPNTLRTRFPIASITKTFTATLVMKAQHERRLNLEDPLCRHLAPCPAPWQAIRLRHLLMHTAGVPDYARDANFAVQRRNPVSRGQIIDGLRPRPLEFPPGSRYSYSNSNYLLLAAALERATGRDYAQLLREQILEPLGMHDSGLDPGGGVVKDLATGHRPQGVADVPADFVDASWLDAAGGIYSTADDLLKWDQALRTERLLPRRTLDFMWSQTHGPYGYGWQLLPPSAQTFNRDLAFHAGGLTGHATDLLRYPKDGATLIILANLLPVPLAEISRDLSAILFGEPYTSPVVRRAARIDPAWYDRLSGRYRLAPSVEIVVTREGNQLAVQATGQPKDIAIPASRTSFYSRTSPARLSFELDAKGIVTALVIHEPSRDLRAPRL